MTEQIVTLAAQLGQLEPDEGLRCLCAAAEQELSARLRPGLSPADCGEAFPLAAAWLVLAGRCSCGDSGVSAFTAGDVTVRTAEDRDRPERLRLLAERLMQPWIRDGGFDFREVPG